MTLHRKQRNYHIQSTEVHVTSVHKENKNNDYNQHFLSSR